MRESQRGCVLVSSITRRPYQSGKSSTLTTMAMSAIGIRFRTTTLPSILRLPTWIVSTTARLCYASPVSTLLPSHAADKQDLIVGQSTWSALHTMYKMHKIYDIPLRGPSGVIPGHLQSFSTYPARISSGDDYYTVGEWMVVQETTIGNYNDDLLKYVNGKAVMQWARNLIANRLAR